LKEHEKVCVEFPPVKIVLPDKETTVEFREYEKMMWNHFCIYSDFECIFKNDIYTPVSFTIFCPLTKDLLYQSFPDPYQLMECFWTKLIDIREKIAKLIDNPKPLKKDDSNDSYDSSDKCWICGKKFLDFEYYVGESAKKKGYVKIGKKYVKYSQYKMIDEDFEPELCEKCVHLASDDSDYDSDYDSDNDYECECICHSKKTVKRIKKIKKELKENVYKVRDHDHITGEFRGWAHSKCNLKLDIIYGQQG
jgi:hypothetical protein